MSGGRHSSGSGGGTSSGRSQFRSQTGCCICGTKSSSSRFTISSRYSEHFAGCFGQNAAARSGDLCNACVLCVKRWLQRDRQSALFSQVLDSKKGPGPKHMKEITKRARRREARKANVMRATSAKSETTAHQSTGITGNQGPSQRNTSGTHSGPSFATRSSVVGSTPSATPAGGINQRSGSTVGDSHKFQPGRHSAYASINHFVSCSASAHVPESSRRANCPWSGRASSFSSGERPVFPCCGQHQRMFFSPKVTGATFTRAAAAAIRKYEASSMHCACMCTKETPSTSSTPSETSEYGSGLFSLSCCSSSSCSRHPVVNEGSCCSSSSCGGASSGIGCGLSHPPCCAFCSSDLTPAKQAKYDVPVDNDRNCLCQGCPCIGHQSLCHAAVHMDCCLSRPEFRHPHPPPGGSSNGRNDTTVSPRTSTDGNDNTSNKVDNLISNSQTASTTTTTTTLNSTPTRRYNRRVVLPPVRMSHNEEVNSLLREIMERNSQAITFDSREMHMAVQKELRLRSRTVQGNSTSDSVSGRASSISSADGSVDARTNSSSNLLISATGKFTTAADQHTCEHFAKRHRIHHCCARYHPHCYHSAIHLRHIPCTCSSESLQHRKT